MVPVGPVALLTKEDSRPATPWEKVAEPRESVPATLTPVYVPFRPKLVSPAIVNEVLAPYTEDWICRPLPLADAESWVIPAALSALLIMLRIVARSAPGGAVTVAVTPFDVTVNVFGGGDDGYAPL